MSSFSLSLSLLSTNELTKHLYSSCKTKIVIINKYVNELTRKHLKYLCRYYQPQELAGGLTLVGGGDYSTGIFAMDFSQPPWYQWPAGSFQSGITFTFKKTVFFADFVMVCLGTGITATNSSPNITQVHLLAEFV